MEKYREKGIFALMAVFSDNWPVVFFERQIYAGPKTKREYFFNIYQLCGDVLLRNVPATLKLGFEHANWDDVRLKEKEVIVVEDSVLQCRKCKSNKVIMDTRQTKTCDEGSTVFAMCTNCKNSWTE